MSATPEYSSPEVATVDANGLSTGVRRAGAGEPLLYLGGQGYPTPWLALFEVLAEKHHVIVPEHPSFGDTELPNDLLDFADLSVHYAALLDALQTGPVHVVGHAFGGWVAAEFASYFPERVRSLSLIAPSGLRPDAEEPMIDPYRLDRHRWGALALGPDAANWLPPVDENAEWADRTLSDYKERIGVARVAWNPRYDLKLERRLQRVTAPAQVLVPVNDNLTAPSIARRYTELLGIEPPRLLSVDGFTTEHLVVVQAPKETAAQVLALTLHATS